MPKDNHSSNFLRENNKFYKQLQKTLDSKDFSSEEELNAFMNENFVGKSPSDLMTTADDSPRGRAEQKLDLVDSANAPTMNRRHALAATKLDPTCIEAWYLLAQTYESPAKSKSAYRKAIKLGKIEFSSEIEDCLSLSKKNDPEKKSWLWGHHEARPFLMAYHELADLYAREDKMKRSIETFEEILRLNGNDNQGIRHILLPLYMLHEPAEKIETLLAHFPDDTSPQWLFTKALYTFQKTYALKAADGSWDFKKTNNKKNITDLVLLPQLTSDFDDANALLNQALESNPLVRLFLYDARCSYFSTADSHMAGGADEAFITAQNIGLLWILDTMAQLWLQESCLDTHQQELLMKAAKKHAQHLAELDQMLDQVDINSIKDPEFAKASEFTTQIRKIVIKTIAPEKNNILPFQ